MLWRDLKQHFGREWNVHDFLQKTYSINKDVFDFFFSFES